MAKKTYQIGDSVVVKPGVVYEEFDLSIGGWQGRVADIDEDADLYVVWDRQTIEAIPETAVIRWLEEETDWTGMFVEPDMVKAASPRDELDDWVEVARKRYAAHGVDMDEVVWNPLLDDPLADWFDDLLEDPFDNLVDELPSLLPFSFDQFCIDNDIPAKEHGSLRRCLSVGLGHYYNDIYGYYKFGKQPAHYDNVMHEPYIFGYGVVEILQHEKISFDTKFKVCQHSLRTMNPAYENGIPYGMITVLGFLAGEDKLPLGIFLMGMTGLEYGGIGLFRRPIWMEGATKEDLFALADWIKVQAQIPLPEKTWWLWKLTVACEDRPHLGKALATHWLKQPDVPDSAKEALCWGWLEDRAEPGQPPLAWRLMAAQQMGDLDLIKQLLTEAGIDPEQVPLPAEEDIKPMTEDDAFIHEIRHGIQFVLIPAYLRRLAIPGLIRYGQDLETVVEMFWDSDREYYADAMNNGIADAIKEFHDRLSLELLRRLMEQGIQYGKAATRKTFYALSVQFYGNHYLEQALTDNAKSVRTWAEKKLNKA